ncbi:MAG: ImmA/IrrE family metallo-endopeptidase [Pseudomonadota bacterium]
MKTPSEAAKEFLSKYWDGTLPVQPKAIAEKVGIEVIPDPDLAKDGLSGKFEYVDGKPVIRYNPSEPEVRQRFTIAHEFGHFALDHRGVFRDPTKNFSLSNYDPKEVAANKFAAECLMPAPNVRSLVLNGSVHLNDLASEFNVSEVAMRHRLSNLGLTD